MATETDNRSLAYAEDASGDGEPVVHYVCTFGKLDGTTDPLALCGESPPAGGWNRVAFVHVEGYKTALNAATCGGCLERAAALRGRVPVGA